MREIGQQIGGDASIVEIQQKICSDNGKPAERWGRKATGL